MFSCNIGNYLIKRKSERHIIIIFRSTTGICIWHLLFNIYVNDLFFLTELANVPVFPLISAGSQISASLPISDAPLNAALIRNGAIL